MSLAICNHYWSPFVLGPESDYGQSLEILSEKNLQRGQCQKIALHLISAKLPLGEPLLARLGDITSKNIQWHGKEMHVQFQLPADFSLGEQSICIVCWAQSEEVWLIFREENCVTIIDSKEVNQ